MWLEMKEDIVGLLNQLSRLITVFKTSLCLAEHALIQ